MRKLIFLPILLLIASCAKDEDDPQPLKTIVEEKTVCVETPNEETVTTVRFDESFLESDYSIEILVWNIDNGAWAPLPQDCTDQNDLPYYLEVMDQSFFFVIQVTEFGHDFLPDTHVPCFDFRLTATPK